MALRYYIDQYRCCLCDRLIIDGQYWFPRGCPITPQDIQQPSKCLLSNKPIHIECWVNEHLKSTISKCQNLQSWLLNKKQASIRKTCYYLHPLTQPQQPPLDEHRLLHCPLRCHSHQKTFLLKRTESIELRCWMDRHLYVCEQFIQALHKRKGSTSQISISPPPLPPPLARPIPTLSPSLSSLSSPSSIATLSRTNSQIMKNAVLNYSETTTKEAPLAYQSENKPTVVDNQI